MIETIKNLDIQKMEELLKKSIHISGSLGTKVHQFSIHLYGIGRCNASPEAKKHYSALSRKELDEIMDSFTESVSEEMIKLADLFDDIRTLEGVTIQ